MDIVSVIHSAWGWCGLVPVRVVDENDFGNLLIEDALARYWRVCPEDLLCELVAADAAALAALRQDPQFDEDWRMQALVEMACEALGPLAAGQKYCLKVPGTLGGEYGGDNLGKISLRELIAASGHIAQQIEGLPDGARVQFRFVD